ncbi:MAG: DUF433 domain-containing protein [Oscillatoriales cyanobacterium]|nr:MAG: DUF433 domain-containing protein [Oscillatoriales cyanobacterium]
MNLVLEVEAPPFREDATGAIRVGNFQDGASPESIVQRYSTVSLSDVYSAIGYYLRHQEVVEAYLNYREKLADSVHQRLLGIQPDLTVVRSRLLAQKNLEG